MSEGLLAVWDNIVNELKYTKKKKNPHKFYLILYSVFQKQMLFFRHLLCMKLRIYLYLSSLDSVRLT